jgi:indolepyruvate ferredoxin oxidoreductase beta subunit
VSDPIRPVTILIASLGGEGGAVLANWLVTAATMQGFPVQSTSIPGVAQRTGSTTYYIEIFPEESRMPGARRPVLSLTPYPGNVDIAAASELVEAGRILQGGYVDPQRTVLIASTHREYAVSEKAAMGDGRYDGQRVLAAAQTLSRRCVFFDMRALALKHGTVINTVIFGAMAASGVLPLSREACEAAIRKSARDLLPSLRGFDAGYAASGNPPQSDSTDASAPARAAPSQRLLGLSPAIRKIVEAGVSQTLDYQSERYAALYLDRVEAIQMAELAQNRPLLETTRETARYLALWMSYEDVIRVADLKTRLDRIGKVRQEVGAREGEPLRLTEYLKPGLDEICSILPPKPASWLRRKLAHKAHTLNIGLHMRTDTVAGFAMLCVLRSLRPLRPRTSRYAAEQALIERWLSAIRSALIQSSELASELALCGNLVKGYGATNERGHRNLGAILDAAEQATNGDLSAALQRVRSARIAALADPEGRQLAGALGLPIPEPKAHPIRIVRRGVASTTRPTTIN